MIERFKKVGKSQKSWKSQKIIENQEMIKMSEKSWRWEKRQKIIKRSWNHRNAGIDWKVRRSLGGQKSHDFHQDLRNPKLQYRILGTIQDWKSHGFLRSPKGPICPVWNSIKKHKIVQISIKWYKNQGRGLKDFSQLPTPKVTSSLPWRRSACVIPYFCSPLINPSLAIRSPHMGPLLVKRDMALRGEPCLE